MYEDMVAPNSSLAVIVIWKGTPAVLVPPEVKLLKVNDVKSALTEVTDFNIMRKKSIVIVLIVRKNFILKKVKMLFLCYNPV